VVVFVFKIIFDDVTRIVSTKNSFSMIPKSFGGFVVEKPQNIEIFTIKTPFEVVIGL